MAEFNLKLVASIPSVDLAVFDQQEMAHLLFNVASDEALKSDHGHLGALGGWKVQMVDADRERHSQNHRAIRRGLIVPRYTL